MSLWVYGVCDTLLVKILRWQRDWPQGREAATRLFMHKDGRQENLVTKRRVYVTLHMKEMEHLVRILKALRPDWTFVNDLEAYAATGFRRARMAAGGERVATMVSYEPDVKEILAALLRARSGETGPDSLVSDLKDGTFWNQVDAKEKR